MPIIVKEIIVKASIQEGKAGSTDKAQPLPFNEAQRKQLISEAVELTLEELQKIKER